jgi:hypothetical protein
LLAFSGPVRRWREFAFSGPARRWREFAFSGPVRRWRELAFSGPVRRRREFAFIGLVQESGNPSTIQPTAKAVGVGVVSKLPLYCTTNGLASFVAKASINGIIDFQSAKFKLSLR